MEKDIGLISFFMHFQQEKFEARRDYMYKVHVAFGFHVNLYHSYRGNSNDDKGFGGDIRVIRNTIDVLNKFNNSGVPVKAVWDFENAFSIEKILPEYAPDILSGVKERVEKFGDETIIMGYNNGFLSAMDNEEFKTSIDLAVSNSRNSGILDTFGRFYPMVRPQEVMFTPSHVSLYNELSIRAVCLYYSAVAFDAFRTLIPQLPEKYSYNPLWYKYKGEKTIIIPMRNNGDLLEHGSLKNLARKLHHKQLTGEIQTDVLIFINLDADSEIWYGFNLPFLFKKIPNINGIEGLVNEIKCLDYIVFDTPGNYLDNHLPQHTISFNQDTADGSFDGYASWAEKPFNHLIWTRIERARLIAKNIENLITVTENRELLIEAEKLKEKAFYYRIKLLSTTHFGLSSPVLNVVREKAALDISRKMLDSINAAEALFIRDIKSKESSLEAEVEAEAEAAFDSINLAKDTKNEISNMKANDFIKILFYIINEDRRAYTHFTINLKEGLAAFPSQIHIRDSSDTNVEAAFLDIDFHKDKSIKTMKLFFSLTGNEKLQRYYLCISKDFTDKKIQSPALKQNSPFVKDYILSGENIIVRLNSKDEICEISTGGVLMGGADFLKHRIKYRHNGEEKEYSFKTLRKEFLKPERHGNMAGFRFSGEISLPNQLSEGFFTMDLFIVKGIPSLMARLDIQYPYTEEKHEIYNEYAALQRYCDDNWIEVIPFQLNPEFEGTSINVIKHNYQEDMAAYDLEDFKNADIKNEKLDSFNNHITNGFVGVSDGHKGLVIASDRFSMSSPAFCPMRTKVVMGRRFVYMNPFGTYFGRQRHHTTHGSGLGYLVSLAASVQLKSLAPAFNGVRTGFTLAMFPFKGNKPEITLYNQIRNFCDSYNILIPSNQYIKIHAEDSVSMNTGNIQNQNSGKQRISRKKKTSRNIPLSLKLKILFGGRF